MKQYTIRQTRYGHRGIRQHDWTGTLPELIDVFSYTLLKGHSWEHERGNKKINMQPRTIASLINNLNNAEDNAARNGFSGTSYELVEA